MILPTPTLKLSIVSMNLSCETLIRQDLYITILFSTSVAILQWCGGRILCQLGEGDVTIFTEAPDPSAVPESHLPSPHLPCNQVDTPSLSFFLSLPLIHVKILSVSKSKQTTFRVHGRCVLVAIVEMATSQLVKFQPLQNLFLLSSKILGKHTCNLCTVFVYCLLIVY